MRSHLENTVKHEILQTQPESVTPIPSEIFNNPMSVHLDPNVETYQYPSPDPTEGMIEEGLRGREVEAGPAEDRVGEKVVEKDKIDEMTKE
jgi:hypothetical protein